MTGPKPKRIPADTVRLKRDIAQADSTYAAKRAEIARGTSDPNASATAVAAFQTGTAKQDTLTAIRNGVPPGPGHKSFAEGVDGFDGRTLTTDIAPKPARASIPRGTTPSVSLPSATGRPSGIQLHDGTDSPRANTQTLQAGDARHPSTSPRKSRAGIASFTDNVV